MMFKSINQHHGYILEIFKDTYYSTISNEFVLKGFDAELLNVSIRRIRLFSRILLNKKNRRKFNL